TERVRRTRYRLADADGITTAQLTEDEVSTVDSPAAAAGEPAAGQRVLTVQAGPADTARLVQLLTGARADRLAGPPELAGSGWPLAAEGESGAAPAGADAAPGAAPEPASEATPGTAPADRSRAGCPPAPAPR